MGLASNDYIQVGKAFFPDAVWSEVRLITSGHIHSTYYLRNIEGECYLLQRINQEVFRDLGAMEFNFSQLQKYLPPSSEGLLFPRLYSNVAGNILHQSEDDTFWRMQSFISGTFSPQVCDDFNVAYQAGFASGVFLRKLDEVLPCSLKETIPAFHDIDARWQKLSRVFNASNTNQKLEATALFREITQLWTLLQPLLAQKELPVRQVHNDPKLSNMLFDVSTGAVIAIIDWDTIMPGTVLTDYGDLVRSVCSTAPEDESDLSNVTINPDYLKSLTEGFRNGLKNMLTPEEDAFLYIGPYWIILEQAIRFLTDYLEGNVYYQIDYPRHNWVRSCNQVTLLKAYIDQADIQL
ncbi:MAG: aminoglycoside phosphotransferase family protein [Saprospiraceae bacterium]|nr:aminoglycoside phosphotransferase family protein [Saprospiraceae bacterium]